MCIRALYARRYSVYTGRRWRMTVVMFRIQFDGPETESRWHSSRYRMKCVKDVGKCRKQTDIWSTCLRHGYKGAVKIEFRSLSFSGQSWDVFLPNRPRWFHRWYYLLMNLPTYRDPHLHNRRSWTYMGTPRLKRSPDGDGFGLGVPM